MTAKNTKALAVADDELMKQLEEGYAQEEGYKGIFFPRISMLSKDKTEETGKGKDKKIKVLAAAGEFSIERPTEEVGEDGKKIWAREELGTEFEGIIFYKRHQLRMFNEGSKSYVNSPIYDADDEVIPLFENKKEIERGTPKELQDKYMITNKKGKKVSSLEKNRILYVLYKGEVFQMQLRGSSLWALSDYERGVVSPTVVTKFSSEEAENGDVTWQKMTFKAVRKVTTEEAKKIIELKNTMNTAIAASKATFADAKALPAGKDEDDF